MGSAARLLRVNENDLPSERHIPIIHHSVVERFNKVIGYRPHALRGRRYKIYYADGSLSDPLCGITGLSN